MKPETLNELALFAGAGGGILGGKLRGWRTVCAVEWDAYARDVLVARQNDGCLEAFPIWDDVQTFDGRPWRGRVDVVSGGFPCQDISAAGKGAGIDGERSGMWKHMARIIGEVLPRLVFVENSPMLVGRGLGTVLADLAAMGYDARWGIVGAHHAGAPHKRDRIWIVAHTDSARLEEHRALLSGLSFGSSSPKPGEKRIQEKSNVADPKGRKDHGRKQGNMDGAPHGGKSSYTAAVACCENVGDPLRIRQPGQGQSWYASDPAESIKGEADHAFHERIGHIWGIESSVGRVAHGVAARVDRLKAIGNGQVPAVAALAWRILTGRINS